MPQKHLLGLEVRLGWLTLGLVRFGLGYIRLDMDVSIETSMT